MSWDPEEHLGETITLRGTACDARAGAMLLLPDETPVYVIGLFSWDEELSGNEVEVTGQLEKKPSRTPRVPPNEDQSHGVGERFVIREATWTVVTPHETVEPA